ncbi:MAG: uroporphyrinogen-III synthase [Hyphomicrobium sp.]
MHVLITRPERDAADLRSRIEALGCRVTVAPLLSIELGPIDVAALAGATGIVATSRNGLRALAQSAALPAATRLPIFVVGPATAALARDLGFSTVFEGGGNAEGLVPCILECKAALGGPLVHLAGDHLAFDLGSALDGHGIILKAIAAYRSVAAKTLDASVSNLLATGRLDAVILMSPRSARTWSTLIDALPVKTDVSKVTHICLSPAVAQALGSMRQTTDAIPTEIANQPNSEEIVALVYRLAAETKTG